MIKNELISIIVPIYNVEKYLERCVLSIIHQTYQNIEIILVNDGSTDKSGELANNLAKKDARIKVVHKNNGGLSEARNEGIKNSVGKYILLVDSDDYILETTCEELIQIAIEYDSDMVSFREKKIYEGNLTGNNKQIPDTKNIILLTGNEAGKNYLYGRYIQHSACSKLYKRELFDKLLFPTGKLAEDMATTYLYVSFCNKIIFYDRQLYMYCIRENSIMTQASLKLVLDVYDNSCKIYEFEKEKFFEHLPIIETKYCNCLLKTIARIYNERNNSDLYQIKNDIEYRLKKVDLKLVPLKTKGVYFLYTLNKTIFSKIMKKIGKNG